MIMLFTDLFKTASDSCPVCGQTPCNCTGIMESSDCHQSRTKQHMVSETGIASPETTFNVLKGLKSWQVVIMNNYYNGKYSDYGGRYYYVLASSPEQARQVVLDNADAILQELLSMKSHNGKKILPRGSALRITADRIGEIRDGTEAGRMTTMGYKKMFGPQGPMMVKLNNGAIADVQGQEQGVAEGSDGAVSFREMIDVVDQHYPKYYAELSGSDISDKQFERAIVNAYKEIIKKQGVAEGQTPEQEIERLKLRQNAEHGGASLKRQAATQARIRELEKQIKDKKGVAEGDIGQLEKDIADAPVKPIANMEGNEKIGGRYNPDEFDAMVGRLKKLAGTGPLKTVWDPVKRVYKNVPVAQQPKSK